MSDDNGIISKEDAKKFLGLISTIKYFVEVAKDTLNDYDDDEPKQRIETDTDRTKWFNTMNLKFDSTDYRTSFNFRSDAESLNMLLIMNEYIGEGVEAKSFNMFGYETPLNRQTMNINNRKVTMVIDAYMKIRNFVLMFNYQDETSHITLYGSQDKSEDIKKFGDKLYERIVGLELLRGMCFTANGGNISAIQRHIIGRDAIIVADEIFASMDSNLFHIAKDSGETSERIKVPWKRGLLLYGPPGCGKTLLTHLISSELLNTTVIYISPQSISDRSEIAWSFDNARKLAPSVMIFEDMDMMARDRDSGDGDQNAVLGELLTQLDGVKSNEGLFIVATTNNIESLDEAIRERPSRFDVKLHIDYPTPTLRQRLYALYAPEITYEGEGNYDLSELSDGFSGAHIREAVIRGRLKSDREGKTLYDAMVESIYEIREERRKVEGKT